MFGPQSQSDRGAAWSDRQGTEGFRPSALAGGMTTELSRSDRLGTESFGIKGQSDYGRPHGWWACPAGRTGEPLVLSQASGGHGSPEAWVSVVAPGLGVPEGF